MFLNAQRRCVALLLVSGLVAASTGADAGESSWDEGNLIANGRFESSGADELPEGWAIVAPNKALGPHFAVLRDSTGGTRLAASGNGRDECFGFIKHPVHLSGGKTFRLRVRLKAHGLEDLNRHLVHGIFGHGFNEGVFEYRREGDWIIG